MKGTAFFLDSQEHESFSPSLCLKPTVPQIWIQVHDSFCQFAKDPLEFQWSFDRISVPNLSVPLVEGEPIQYDSNVVFKKILTLIN